MNKPESQEDRVEKPPAGRPVMVFDGDCGFCRFWIERWRTRTGGSVDYEPFQKVAADHPEIPRVNFENAVQLIEPNGKVSSGADAVFRALALAEKKSRLLPALLAVPGFTAAARGAYRFIARNRAAASFLTRLLFGASLKPPT